MWQPDNESLKLLVDLLNESQVPDNTKQHEIHEKITELTNNPEFSSYLVYILAISEDNSIKTLRRIAGATLKGVIERHFDKIQSERIDFIKLKLMEAFNDSSSLIRSTVINAMTALLAKIGFQSWPELMKFLLLNLDADHHEFLESSLECTYKILEDIKVNADNFDYQDEKYQSFVSELIPKLLFLCDPKLPTTIKTIALSSLNLFVFSMPAALFNNFGIYYDVLMLSTTDQVAEVRQKACEGFLEIVETKMNLIAPNMVKVVEKLIQLTMDNESIVKRSAIRFWNEYLIIQEGESPEKFEILRNYLDQLVPSLINSLQYTEEDLLNQEEERQEIAKSYKDNLYKQNGEKGDDGGDRYNHQGLWTVRREAAKAMDTLADRYKDEVFIKAQDKIAEALRSNDWHIKESGILCLGALAMGAYNAIIPHFKDLFPFLLKSLEEDQHPLVRSISCWALSRFTSWIVEQGKIDQNVVITYLQKILQKMMDENSKVQEASCSALSKITYENPALVEQYIFDIMEVIKHVYENYQKKSLTNLYDVIASLSSTIPREKMQDPRLQSTILDILMKKWDQSHFNDRESIYLVECTDGIFSTIGTQSINNAEFFIQRLLYLIFHYIEARNNEDKTFLYHKKEIAVRCFDLLGTFLCNIGQQAEKFINSDDYLRIFFECIQDQELAIRRVTLASGGEVAKYCPTVLQGKIDQLVQHYMNNLYVTAPENDPEGLFEFCCNNSAWAIGELALAYPTEFGSIAPHFVSRITEVLNDENNKVAPPLDQNLAVALGRLGLVNPDAVAEALDKILKPFCLALDKIKANPEKQEAFRGLFLAISKNPNGIVKDFQYLCNALVNFENAEADLQELGSKLIVNFKAVAGQFWNSYFDSFPVELQDKMKQRFGV